MYACQIATTLRDHSNVTFTTATEAFELATHSVESPRTQEFIKGYYSKVLGIMLDQASHKHVSV